MNLTVQPKLMTEVMFRIKISGGTRGTTSSLKQPIYLAFPPALGLIFFWLDTALHGKHFYFALARSTCHNKCLTFTFS